MHKAQLCGPALRTRKTDHPYTQNLQRVFSERTHVYPTYVHLTLPVRFITPTELQTDTDLPINQPAYYQVRIEYVNSGLADYANKITRTRKREQNTSYNHVRSRT